MSLFMDTLTNAGDLLAGGGGTGAIAKWKPFRKAGEMFSGIGKGRAPDPRTRFMSRDQKKSLAAGDTARSLRLGGAAKAQRVANENEVARVDSLFPSAPGRSDSVFKSVTVGEGIPDRVASWEDQKAAKDSAHAKEIAGIKAAGTERRSMMQTQHDERMARLEKQFGGPSVGRVASPTSIAKATQNAERRNLVGQYGGMFSSTASTAKDKAATTSQRSRFDANRKTGVSSGYSAPKGTMAKPVDMTPKPLSPALGAEDDEIV